MQLNQPFGGQFTAWMINGAQTYMLFASMVERTSNPAEPLSSSRAAFWILDTLSFADVISRWIPGFIHERFSHEAEYRFICFAEGQLQPFIDPKCLPAPKFCERMVPPSTATP
jgi:hypothetical protein